MQEAGKGNTEGNIDEEGMGRVFITVWGGGGQSGMSPVRIAPTTLHDAHTNSSASLFIHQSFID